MENLSADKIQKLLDDVGKSMPSTARVLRQQFDELAMQRHAEAVAKEANGTAMLHFKEQSEQLRATNARLTAVLEKLAAEEPRKYYFAILAKEALSSDASQDLAVIREAMRRCLSALDICEGALKDAGHAARPDGYGGSGSLHSIAYSREGFAALRERFGR